MIHHNAIETRLGESFSSLTTVGLDIAACGSRQLPQACATGSHWASEMFLFLRYSPKLHKRPNLINLGLPLSRHLQIRLPHPRDSPAAEDKKKCTLQPREIVHGTGTLPKMQYLRVMSCLLHAAHGLFIPSKMGVNWVRSATVWHYPSRAVRDSHASAQGCLFAADPAWGVETKR